MKKKSLFLFGIFLGLLCSVACSNKNNSSSLSSELVPEIIIGENGNWIISGKDTQVKAKGEDGREVTFRINSGVLEWKYVDEDSWTFLIDLESDNENITSEEIKQEQEIVVSSLENSEVESSMSSENLEEISSSEITELYSKGLILQEVTGEGYMVVGYEGEDNEIIIPSYYRNIPIYKIQNEAFKGSSIRKINIGDNIRIIGECAFEESDIEEVIFNSNSQLEEIGDACFYNCHSLEKINIPSTLKKLGECAFFLLDSLICEYDDIYGVKYIGNDENPHLILYDSVGSSIKKCVVNKDCKFIADYAFTYCSQLGEIEIPEGVLSIGTSALYSCGALRELYIPSSVNHIGNGTINCSSGIEKIVVNANNPYYDSRENSNAIIETKTNTLMYGCKNTFVPESITSIRDKAFYGNDAIEELHIPKNVDSIGQYVFSMCSGLSKLSVDPKNATFTSRDSNGTEANVIIKKGSYSQTLLYGGCSEDGTLIVPNGVTSIETEAFRGRLLLKEITIPKTVTSIKDYAFDYCKNLNTIYNASKLVFEIKSNSYGGIAYYATNIYNI